MTLADVKRKIFGDENYALTLNYSEDVNGVKDENWFRHWNNEERIAVSIPADSVKELKTSSAIVMQVEQRTGEKGIYTAYRVFVPENKPDVVL